MPLATHFLLPACDNDRMGTLYLVRHGQASLGANNYDQLSDLGQRQSIRLGQYWHECNMSFDAVITGTLQRHSQTWEGIASELGMNAADIQTWPGLNEYDSAALIQAVHRGPLQRPDTPDLYREHFRLLRAGLNAWMRGETTPAGMPSYVDFLAGVTGALDRIRENYHGARVLVVSSGGPISNAVGHLLGTSAQTTVELNMRLRNTAITEFAFTPKRHMLVSYNALPHLDAPDYAGWSSYA